MCVLILVLNYFLVSYLASIPLARWLYKEDVPMEMAVCVILFAPLAVPVLTLSVGIAKAVAFLYKHLEKVIEQ
jgi:ABC-type spermidine/putrescine transport system permease subunit II